MKIELEAPFSHDWRYGYIVTNKEPRRNVILFNSANDRSTVSYARYLMSVHLGRYLTSNECVDHINNDKLDDRVENFQILTLEENTEKSMIENNRTKQMVDFECGNCGKEFTRNRNQTYLVIKSRKSTFCSRRCSGTKSKNSIIIREYREGREFKS